jgi:hypothetical protein
MTVMNPARKVALWKGLAGALQRADVTFLGDAQGGYVNVVTSATTLEDFTAKVNAALNELGLELVDLEAEPLPARLSNAHVSEEIRMMAKTVRREGSVAFGTFYVFNELSSDTLSSE